jgi:hypothetical protein
VLYDVSVDVAINTDLVYSAGTTSGSGTSTDWFSASIELTISGTFMFDICDNPGDSIAWGISTGASVFGISGSASVSTIWADPTYDLLGIDFAFSTGFDALEALQIADVELSVEVMFCSTSMSANARDVRSYCNPFDYTGAASKTAPWALSNWDDDLFGWNGRRALAWRPSKEEEQKKHE